MPSFAARRVGSVLVYVHTTAAPSDAEWESVLSFYEDSSPEAQLRTLVYTEGGAPNAAQRARLNARLGPRRVRIAVLTPSTLARAAGTALNWFRPEVRIFGPRDVKQAFSHLAVTDAESSELSNALRELMRELGLS